MVQIGSMPALQRARKDARIDPEAMAIAEQMQQMAQSLILSRLPPRMTTQLLLQRTNGSSWTVELL
jgi:hypothetical protein